MESKKRVFSEPEVIEIAPPVADPLPNVKAKGKQMEVAYHEIIDVDMDEDCDVVLLEGKVDSRKKRKGSMGISLGSSSSAKFDSAKVASNNKGMKIPVDLSHSFKGFNPGSDNFFDLDDYVFDNKSTLHIGLPAVGGNYLSNNSNTQVGSGPSSFSQPRKVDLMPTSTRFSSRIKGIAVGGQSIYFDPKQAPGMAPSTGYPQLATNTADMLPGTGGIYSMNDMLLGQDAMVNGPSSISLSSVESSSSKTKPVDDVVKKRYENFKKFDTVVDHSDHHYVRHSSTMRQPPKNWAKKIQEEWKILEKDLPDTIFVRVYESRMDLLRAVIIGAEGTPYHDGLFFFDVCFPSSYPNSPPLVHYHSGGLRINPNLYNCGKVCLSLLNTWTGVQNERWVPSKSTMLQVLVSIQGLILNMKPYFNEPGFAHSSGSVQGEKSSLQYNERTLILSLKTMVYTMNKPPKHFEDLVIGHFQHRVRDILMACKAYTEGVQVGCLVKGGAQDVDEHNNSCSAQFKNDVGSYIETLVAAFKKIGAKEAQEFLSLSIKKSSLPATPSLGLSLSPNPLHSPFPPNGYPPFPFYSIPTAYNHHW